MKLKKYLENLFEIRNPKQPTNVRSGYSRNTGVSVIFEVQNNIIEFRAEPLKDEEGEIGWEFWFKGNNSFKPLKLNNLEISGEILDNVSWLVRGVLHKYKPGIFYFMALYDEQIKLYNSTRFKREIEKHNPYIFVEDRPAKLGVRLHAWLYKRIR